MRQAGGILLLFLLAMPVQGDVRVYVENANGLAWIRYECTGGEVVGAFALDVSVDRGQIISVGDYARGPSTDVNQGYGFFPASFRDQLAPSITSSNVDWTLGSYSPLAVTADAPADTLPGLGSNGVTLEFGGLWNSSTAGAAPPSTGTLCSLRLGSQAWVSISPNSTRGGVTLATGNPADSAVFVGATVHPPEITGLSLTNGTATVTFTGGELETASSAAGPWVGTGNTNGHHAEPAVGANHKFYRVRSR